MVGDETDVVTVVVLVLLEVWLFVVVEDIDAVCVVVLV